MTFKVFRSIIYKKLKEVKNFRYLILCEKTVSKNDKNKNITGVKMLKTIKKISVILFSVSLLSISAVTVNAYETFHDDKDDSDWLILDSMDDMKLLEDDAGVIVDGQRYYVEANIGYHEYDDDGVDYHLNEWDLPKVEKFNVNDYNYWLYGNKAHFEKYTGADDTIEIPDEIEGMPVTAIGYKYEMDYDYDHTGLGKNVKKLIIGKNVSKFVNGYEIIRMVTETSEETTIFDITPTLESIEVSEDNEYYSSQDGILYSKDGKTLLRCPIGKTGTIVIPEGIEEIGYRAFAKCHINQVQFPSTLKKINVHAFYDCDDLQSVYISDKIDLSEDIFERSTIKEIVIGKGHTELPKGLFDWNKIEEIYLPYSLDNEENILAAFEYTYDIPAEPISEDVTPGNVINIHCTEDSAAAKVLKDKDYANLIFMKSDDEIPVPEAIVPENSKDESSKEESSETESKDESSKEEASAESKVEENSANDNNVSSQNTVSAGIKSTDTGDSANIIPYVSLAIAAGAVVFLTSRSYSKKYR